MAETARLSLYPTVELKERLEAITEREHRTLNVQALLMLEEAVERYEAVYGQPLALRSIAVVGDKTIDMVTREEVDAMTLQPKKPRTATCEHRLSPSQFCAVCDG